MPLREPFIAPPQQKSSQGAGGASGISRSWFIWLQTIFNQINSQIAQITALTIAEATQSELAALSSTLPKNALVDVTDYNHILRWNGTSYEWGPGENGSGFIQAFLSAPGSGGWKLCDGSTVNRLNGDGTITAVTIPNYTTPSYVRLATAAAAGPSAPGGTVTSISAGTPGGTIANGNESADTTFNAAAVGTPTTVAAAPHTHVGTFTGAPLAVHTHSPGSIELQRTTLLAYYRQ